MKVAVIMGSKSDYDVVYKAENVLADFGVEYESRVISAHRTPGSAAEFAANAEKDGFEVIICAAGKVVAFNRFLKRLDASSQPFLLIRKDPFFPVHIFQKIDHLSLGHSFHQTNPCPSVP